MRTPEQSNDEEAFTPGLKLFGRYVLERRCGRGATGVVWRAQDELLGVPVALKLFSGATASERFRTEGRQTRMLSHPNIVRVYDYVEAEGLAAIVMEYVEGTSLAAWRLAQPDGVLSVAEVAAWLPQLCAALDYAHQEARLVHCDVKPANLLLTGEGGLKVADFGVAMALQSDFAVAGSGGTAAYMSPQRLLGETPAPADDVYAVGVTLHELLTGKLPADGGCLLPIWQRAITSCLARDPAARPATLGQMAAEILAGETIATPTERERPNSGAKRPRGRWWIAALAAAAVGAGGLVWSWKKPARPMRVSEGTPAYAKAAGVRPTAAEQGLLVDLPLAGDGASRAGRGPVVLVRNVRPVADRFGLPARALRFDGAGAVTSDLPDSTKIGSGDSWSLAMWMRCEPGATGERTVAELGGEQMGGFGISLMQVAGKLALTASRRLHAASRCEAPRDIADGRWHHVMGAGDGRSLWLWIDGHLENRIDYDAGTAPAPNRPLLTLGHTRLQAAAGFAGDLAEFRLYRRLLHMAEIRRLHQAGPDFSTQPPPFLLSAGVYAETEDLAPALATEFGPGVRLADWEDVKAACAASGSATTWAARWGLRSGDNALVTRAGVRWSAPDRHYFLSRLDGQRPDYYLAHDEIDRHALALGSWHSLRMRALVVYPGAPLPAPRSGDLSWAEAKGDLRMALSPPAGASVAVIRHRLTVGATSAANLRLSFLGASDAVFAELRMRSGVSGTLRLECAQGGRDFWRREIAASYGVQDHTLVMRDGRILWRIEKPGGTEPLLQEEIPLVDFRLGALGGVRWESPVRLEAIRWRVE